MKERVEERFVQWREVTRGFLTVGEVGWCAGSSKPFSLVRTKAASEKAHEKVTQASGDALK